VKARIVASNGDDGVELECSHVERPDSLASGDLFVTASVTCGDFRGRTETWIDRRRWSEFLQELAELERMRQGSATLESISPMLLRLTFLAMDHSGHIAIEGLIGVRKGHQVFVLNFSRIEIDPSGLPDILNQLSTFGLP